MKDNYMSALLYSQGWASADVELMKTVQVGTVQLGEYSVHIPRGFRFSSQAKSHLFTVGDGKPIDVDHFAEAHSQFKDQVPSLYSYRVLFLTVPPNFQYRKEKRWAANQRFWSMKFLMYKRSSLVEQRFSF